MLLKKTAVIILSVTFFVGLSVSANKSLAEPIRILADTLFLKSLGIKALTSDPELKLSVAEVSEYQANTISHSAHKFGKCGGFERLQQDADIQESFELMRHQEAQAKVFNYLGSPEAAMGKNPQIEAATKLVSEANLKETVQWLSAYHTRSHAGPENNKHVEDLAEKARQLLANLKYPFQIDLIAHKETTQKTLRVRLLGKDRPNEVVILGGHLDTLNGPIAKAKAPGADDNASGAANIFETLRIVSIQEQPSRSLEFFWYAGEESGLLGSSEIAQTYKQSKVDVVGVFQLDMTLFPGDGELVFGDIADFTNPWLRNYLKSLNDYYVGAKWKETQCGYACSDHAAWNRQGYAAVMPFESTLGTMNPNIHSNKDLLTPTLNFKHSAAFAKLAVAFALDYSNSSSRPSF